MNDTPNSSPAGGPIAAKGYNRFRKTDAQRGWAAEQPLAGTANADFAAPATVADEPEPQIIAASAVPIKSRNLLLATGRNAPVSPAVRDRARQLGQRISYRASSFANHLVDKYGFALPNALGRELEFLYARGPCRHCWQWRVRAPAEVSMPNEHLLSLVDLPTLASPVDHRPWFLIEHVESLGNFQMMTLNDGPIFFDDEGRPTNNYRFIQDVLSMADWTSPSLNSGWTFPEEMVASAARAVQAFLQGRNASSCRLRLKRNEPAEARRFRAERGI